MDDFETAKRKFLANLTDRTIILIFAADTGTILKIDIVGIIILFFLLDFMNYVILRSLLGRTPGDIMFGIVIETGFPRFLRLLSRWFLGYISPFTAFLLHIPAVRWKSLCDSILGINTKIV